MRSLLLLVVVGLLAGSALAFGKPKLGPNAVPMVAEGGSGVTFTEFVAIVNRALAAFDLQDRAVEVVRPTGDTAEALADLRRALARNEASDRDVVLVYFNQGVITGDWDGPHISPIAAYDEEARQVLIMDVDREWYVPYWTADTALLQAMLRPAPAEHGRLAGRRAIWSGSSLFRHRDSHPGQGVR